MDSQPNADDVSRSPRCYARYCIEPGDWEAATGESVGNDVVVVKVPSDHDIPLSVAWLNGTTASFSNVFREWRFENGRIYIKVRMSPTEEAQIFWHGKPTAVVPTPTRGHVLRLCEALGITPVQLDM